MAEGTIDRLSIEIASNSTNAAKNIRELSTSLNALHGSAGRSTTKLTEMARAMESLKSSSTGLKMTSIANTITKISTALAGLPAESVSRVAGVANALKPLANFGGIKLGQLKQLPTVLKEFTGLNVSAFARQMRELNSVLTPLAASVAKLSAAYKDMPRSMRSAGVAARSVKSANENLTGATNALAIATNKAHKSFTLFSGIRAHIATVVAAMYGFKRMFQSTIGEVNSYIENMNLFQASMGKAYESAREYGLKVQEVMGIDFGEWARNQGVFQTLATGMGVTAQKANVMSEQLTQLGYDISSFYNLDVSEAMLKLQSGLAGELEPLRRIGWDLSNARMNVELAKMGIDANAQSMTQAEKVALRYKMIMEQVTIVHGDMARTLASPANQLRILKAQLTLAARAVGSLFIPALNMILPVVIGVVKAIRFLAQEIANFLGIDANFEVDYSGLDTSGIASDDDIGEAADALEDVNDAIDDSGTAADKAAKKVKAYQNTVMGFDELNKLNATPEYDTGSDSSKTPSTKSPSVKTGNGLGVDFGLPTYDFMEGVNKAISELSDTIAKKIVQAIKNLVPIVTGIGAGIAAWKIGKHLVDNAEGISRAMKDAADHAGRMRDNVANTTFGKTKVGAALVTPLDKAQGLLEKIGTKFGVLVPAAALKAVGAWAAAIAVIVVHYTNLAINSEKFRTGVKWVIDHAPDMISPFTTILNHIDDIKKFAGEVAGRLREWWANLPDIGFWGSFKALIGDIVNIFRGARDAVVGFLDKIGALGVVKELVEQFGGAFGQIAEGAMSVVEIFDLKWSDALMTAVGAIALLTPGMQPIGAVVLAAEAASLALRGIGEAMSPAVESVDALGNVSEETAGKFGTSLTSMEEAWQTIDAINFADGIVNEEDVNIISSRVQDIHDTIVNNLDAKKNEELAAIDALAGVLPEEEVEALKQGVEQFYEDFKIKVDEGTQRVLDIYLQHAADHTAVSEAEKEEADRILKEQMQMLMDTSGAGADEIEEITKRMHNNEEAAALHAAEEVIARAREKKEEVEKSANETAQAQIDAAEHALEAGTITKDEYAAIVEAAENTRDDQIAAAQETYDEIERTVKDGLGGAADEIDWQTGQIKQKWEGWLGDLYDRWNETLGSLKMAVEADMRVNGSWVSGFTGQDMGYYGFASGGFPEKGQLFMARENGIPELVGRMGSRTAVANNAQIVEGIESGVTNAMVRVMAMQGSSGGDTIEIPLVISGEELARAVYKGESSLIRRGEIKPEVA